MDIYRNRGKFKLLILVVALIIGLASIYYTRILVRQLAEGEKRQIDLYAKALRTLASDPGGGGSSLIFEEIIKANHTIPVMLTDEEEKELRSCKNLEVPPLKNHQDTVEFMQKNIDEMRAQYEPITVELVGVKVFYKNSYLLTQLRFYPYVQLTIIAIFAVMAYLAFSYSRNSEQNRVWVGMAKETAHQLGTPLSSLMAWAAIFESDPKYDKEMVNELKKDIDRLEMITARFSNIGSAPMLKDEPLEETILNTVNYLKNRISLKVQFSVKSDLPVMTTAKINKALFEWVIENLCKNAVDAMQGTGEINIHIHALAPGKTAIDIQDNGKGIPRSKVKEVFKPGFTTKTRGWGLGLTLVKRIVENYHLGKIFVLQSEPGVGTTFRIILKD